MGTPPSMLPPKPGLERERRLGSGTRNEWIQKNVPNPQKATSLVPAAHSGSPRVMVPRCPCPDVGALLTMIDVQVVAIACRTRRKHQGYPPPCSWHGPTRKYND